MKNLQLIILFLSGLVFNISAQSENKSTVAIFQIDSKGFTIDPVQMGDIARIELAKLELMNVIDKYDMMYLVEKHNVEISNCFGRLCVIEVGKAIKSDKMLTGSIENLGENILVDLRLIDVGTGEVEANQISEYINNKTQLPKMIGLTLKKMLNLEFEEDLHSKLTQKFDYENLGNTPEATKLNLNGPRVGMVFFSGELAKRYQAPKDQGGFDAIPLMFQFGYQFEATYISEGNFQALFEFLPLITGLDQGLFIPSITFLNGLRSSRSGLEFHFGPTLAIAKKADGFYNENGSWVLLKDWKKENGDEQTPFTVSNQLDSRGDFTLNTGFVFGIGKSFRSGRLNIPVNAYLIPGKGGSHRFGISVGFNTTKYK